MGRGKLVIKGAKRVTDYAFSIVSDTINLGLERFGEKIPVYKVLRNALRIHSCKEHMRRYVGCGTFLYAPTRPMPDEGLEAYPLKPAASHDTLVGVAWYTCNSCSDDPDHGPPPGGYLWNPLPEDIRKAQTLGSLRDRAMVFIRPSHVPFPQVWWRFTVQKGGVSIPLRVQDLTDDLVESAVDMLKENFTRDEPPCKYIEINKHPSAVAELEKLWRNTIKDKVSVVCVEDKEVDPQMVGVNILAVSCKEDKEEPFHTEDPVWAQLFGAVELVANSVDVYSHYGVDRYLTAYGLVVAKGWRGLKIGTEILKARVPLCKAFDIKATATVFTAAASQAVAQKAGFVVLHEITYEELAKRGSIFPGIEENTRSSILMGMAID